MSLWSVEGQEINYNNKALHIHECEQQEIEKENGTNEGVFIAHGGLFNGATNTYIEKRWMQCVPTDGDIIVFPINSCPFCGAKLQ